MNKPKLSEKKMLSVKFYRNLRRNLFYGIYFILYVRRNFKNVTIELVKNDHVILFNLFGTVRQVLAFSVLPLELFKLEIIIDYKFIENPPSLPLTILSSIKKYGLKFPRLCIFIMLYMYSKFAIMMFCYYN
jgi:hypothetical protein